MIVVHAVRSHVYAGVERYIATVAPLLVGRGVDVRLIGGEREQMLRSAGEGISHVPASTTTQVARALMRMGSVDIVHVHMTAAEIAGVVTAPAHRGKLVSTRHFTAPRGATVAGRVFAPVIRRRLRAQISVSRAVGDAIGEPSTVLVNGVANQPSGDHRTRTVLLLQRLEAEKETDLALRAWSQSEARNRGWSMVIAGDGSLRGELGTLAERLGVAGSVRFLGHVPEGTALLGSAGLLLAPGRHDAFGFAAVEAMAVATPVVAAAGGGHLETIGSCTTAHLFPPGDTGACAAQIDLLVGDEERRSAYGAELRRHQQAAFDITRHADELVRLYERL